MPTNSEREELAQFLAPANFAATTEKGARLHTLLDTRHQPSTDAPADAQREVVAQKLNQLAQQQRQLQRKGASCWWAPSSGWCVW